MTTIELMPPYLEENEILPYFTRVRSDFVSPLEQVEQMYNREGNYRFKYPHNLLYDAAHTSLMSLGTGVVRGIAYGVRYGGPDVGGVIKTVGTEVFRKGVLTSADLAQISVVTGALQHHMGKVIHMDEKMASKGVSMLLSITPTLISSPRDVPKTLLAMYTSQAIMGHVRGGVSRLRQYIHGAVQRASTVLATQCDPSQGYH